MHLNRRGDELLNGLSQIRRKFIRAGRQGRVCTQLRKVAFTLIEHLALKKFDVTYVGRGQLRAALRLDSHRLFCGSFLRLDLLHVLQLVLILFPRREDRLLIHEPIIKVLKVVQEGKDVWAVFSFLHNRGIAGLMK